MNDADHVITGAFGVFGAVMVPKFSEGPPYSGKCTVSAGGANNTHTYIVALYLPAVVQRTTTEIWTTHMQQRTLWYEDNCIVMCQLDH